MSSISSGIVFCFTAWALLQCSYSVACKTVFSSTTKMDHPLPQSCDTFVVVGDSVTLFGKNSDRPETEVHEVVRFPRVEHGDGTRCRCQYIEIPQAKQTHAVILSRPAWLWGAEMGANEHGVCVGNEAVSSRLEAECDDGTRRLLGMDLVRLVLERSATAREALDVGTRLLEEFGQGGPCMEDGDWCYENSFLICDNKEAYVLETAGAHYWAAEHVPRGKRRNISNGLSIRIPTHTHPDLVDFCKKQGWYNSENNNDTFDWKQIMLGSFASDDLQICGREKAGREWLSKISTADPTFHDMAQCLRDTRSGICMRGGFESTGSQISLLSEPNNIHWFTTGSDPSQTCYKPFGFASDGAAIGRYTNEETDTAGLWRAHKQKNRATREKLKRLESELLARTQETNASIGPELFLQAVKRERNIVEGKE